MNDSKITRTLSRLGALLTAMSVFAAAAPPMAAAGLATIEARVAKLRDSHGQVICTLFTPSDSFPDRSHKGMTIAVPIANRQAMCRFENVAYGAYAMVVFHDENHDGEFNQNWLGMPKEGFGFSDNPGTLRKPSFSDAEFIVGQPRVQLTIKLNYWF